MVNERVTVLPMENNSHPQLQSAFHFVSVLCHPAWSIRNDLYHSAMQELWARDYRIRKVLNKTTLSELVGRVQTVIPKSKLAKYGDFRYDWTTEDLYKKVSCSHGADFELSNGLQLQETDYKCNDDLSFFNPNVQRIIDCMSIPVDGQGNENVVSHWLLVLQHLMMDVQRAAFHSTEIEDKWTNDVIETCDKFVLCSQLSQPLDDIVNMPCHIDLEQLCSEPVCQEEILSIKQPAIHGESRSKEEQNAIERLWLNISLSQIRSLWIEDAFSTKYGMLPDSLSYAMGESSNIVPVTNFLNRELKTSCETVNGHIFVSDTEAKHLLGNLLDLLNHGIVKEYPTETFIQAKTVKDIDYNSASKPSLQKNDFDKNASLPLHLSISDLKDENATTKRNQNNDNRPQSSSVIEKIIGSESVMVSNTPSPLSVRTVNIPSSSSTTIVTGERFTQVPFFYMPHVPLTASPLRAPQTLPFYQPRPHLPDHGQYVPTMTHPYPALTIANPSQLCYYRSPSPITYVTSTAYSPQAVSPQMRPPLRAPAPSALPFYPPASHLQSHVSAVTTSRFSQSVYQFDHNSVSNFTSLQPNGISSGVRCEARSSTYYSLQSTETVRPVIPVVSWYVQPRLTITGNQSPTQRYQSPFVLQRTYVPLSPYRTTLVPLNDQYYPQAIPRSSTYPQTYPYQAENSQCVDQLSQPQNSFDKKSAEKEKSSATETSADSSSSNLSQLSTCPSIFQNNVLKTRVNVQLTNKKKVGKIQQKMPKCKSLLKSAYSKNRTEKLKLSDFLFLGQPSSTSSFGKRKYKKELSGLKKDEHLRNPLNSDITKDLKKISDSSCSASELSSCSILTEGNGVSHSTSMIVTETSNILDVTIDNFNLNDKSLVDQWLKSPSCKQDTSMDEGLGLSPIFSDENSVDERFISSFKYDSDNHDEFVRSLSDDEFSVHQEFLNGEVGNISGEYLYSPSLSEKRESDEAFPQMLEDKIKYDQVLYSVKSLDINSLTL